MGVALVMASGMNTHEAIVFNVLSSLPVFVGIFIGEAMLHIDGDCDGYDPNYNGELRPCDQPEQFCAAASLGLTIYIAFGAVLSEANAAEIHCHQSTRSSRQKIFFIQQFAILCGFGLAVLLACFSPRTIFEYEF